MTLFSLSFFFFLQLGKQPTVNGLMYVLILKIFNFMPNFCYRSTTTRCES